MDEHVRELIQMGRDHYERGEYDKAERMLSEVTRTGRGYADIYNMLGVQIGMHDAAFVETGNELAKRQSQPLAHSGGPGSPVGRQRSLYETT